MSILAKIKRIPLEIYVFVLLPVIVFSIYGFIDPSLAKLSSVSFKHTAIYYFAFGGYLFLDAFLVIDVYLLAKICIWITEIISQKLGLTNAKAKISRRPNWAAIRSTLFLFTMILLVSAWVGWMATFINQIGLGRVVEGSAALMAFDKAVFGFYPPFTSFPKNPEWFFDVLALFLVLVYKMLSLFFSVVFLAVLVKSKELFRKFILVFFLTCLFGFPIWYRYPAISPHLMYGYNVLGAPIAPSIQRAVRDDEVNPIIKVYIASIKMDIDGVSEERVKFVGQKYYSLTTFPSMHAAWGVVIAYFAIMIWPPLGLIFVPWAVVNLFAAVITQWHYAVDMLLGGGIGLFTIILVNFLVAREAKWRKTDKDFLIVGVIQSDFRKAIMGIQKYAKDFWNQTRIVFPERKK